jgi:hypothetical protein
MGLLACMEQNREPEDKKERKKERTIEWERRLVK